MKRQPTLDPETVLEFWFGGRLDDPAEVKQRFKRWFDVDPDFDCEIRERFGTAVDAAGRGELRRLTASPRGALAVILLLDQFPRNIFRGHPDAFAFDDRALACCRDGITRGLDVNLNTIERSFFYLPLEHAEDLQDTAEKRRAVPRTADVGRWRVRRVCPDQSRLRRRAFGVDRTIRQVSAP